MKIYHGGPGYKEDERMHWLSKKRYKIGLVIPTLVVYMVFIIIPIGMSIGYSFTKYSGIGKATFNGLTNYMRLFKDRLFWISLKNTMIMFILAFVLLLSLSFLIALLLFKVINFFSCDYRTDHCWNYLGLYIRSKHWYYQ